MSAAQRYRPGIVGRDAGLHAACILRSLVRPIQACFGLSKHRGLAQAIDHDHRIEAGKLCDVLIDQVNVKNVGMVFSLLFCLNLFICQPEWKCLTLSMQMTGIQKTIYVINVELKESLGGKYLI